MLKTIEQEVLADPNIKKTLDIYTRFTNNLFFSCLLADKQPIPGLIAVALGMADGVLYASQHPSVQLPETRNQSK